LPGEPLPTGTKQPITKVIWQDFEKFQQKASRHGSGAFAVSIDGKADGYSWCPDVADQCIAGPSFESMALDGCRQSGTPCRLFYDHGGIVVPYEIVE
jgi:hypothetical protein